MKTTTTVATTTRLEYIGWHVSFDSNSKCFAYDDFSSSQIHAIPWINEDSRFTIYCQIAGNVFSRIQRTRAPAIYLLYLMGYWHRKIIIFHPMPFTCVHAVNWLQFWKLSYELLEVLVLLLRLLYVCHAAAIATHWERNCVLQMKFLSDICTIYTIVFSESEFFLFVWDSTAMWNQPSLSLSNLYTNYFTKCQPVFSISHINLIPYLSNQQDY